MFTGLLLGLIVLFCSWYSKGDVVSVSCGHIENSSVNVLNLTQFYRENISDFTLNVTTTVASNVFVESECCEKIVASGSSCSRMCTVTGLRVCHLQAEKTLEFDLNKCLSASSVNVTCLTAVYPTHTTPTPTHISSMTTASGSTASTLSSLVPSTTTDESSSATNISTTPTITSSRKGSTVPANSNVSSTSDNLHKKNNTSESAATHTGTTESTISSTITNVFVSSTLESTNTSSNGTSTEVTFDEDQAMTDLYTFLIVLTVVLVLVALLVAGFFIRRKRDKVAITQEDCELEYWHNQEYIDSVVDKTLAPKSFSLNPVYNKDNQTSGSGEATSPSVIHRYKKRADTDFKHRSHGRQGATSGRVYRQRSEDARAINADLENKYVATATGSHFYSYDGQNSEPLTNLDDDSPTEITNPIHGNNSAGSSFKPQDNNGARRKKRSGDRRRYHDDEGERSRRDNMEVYAMSYKDRLKKNLDNWSAEESDV